MYQHLENKAYTATLLIKKVELKEHYENSGDYAIPLRLDGSCDFVGRTASFRVKGYADIDIRCP